MLALVGWDLSCESDLRRIQIAIHSHGPSVFFATKILSMIFLLSKKEIKLRAVMLSEGCHESTCV